MSKAEVIVWLVGGTIMGACLLGVVFDILRVLLTVFLRLFHSVRHACKGADIIEANESGLEDALTQVDDLLVKEKDGYWERQMKAAVKARQERKAHES